MTFAAVLILTCVFALLPAGRARTLSASEAQAKPRLELDLGRHGYRTEDKFAFLGYSGDDTIVFVWLTYRESLWKTNVHQVPAVAHLLSLNAKTGALLGSATWPVFSYPMRAFALTGGRSMLCSGSTLRVYSAKAELEHERVLSGRDVCSAVGSWSGYAISPDRNQLLIAGSEFNDRPLQLLTIEPLEVSEVAQVDSRANFIADATLATCCTATGGFSLRAADGVWRNVEPDGEVATATHGRESATFLGDNAVVIPSLRQISVVTLTGHVLFQTSVEGEQEEVGRFAAAQRMERLAVMKLRLSGPNAPTLDLYPGCEDESVTVYDVQSSKTLLEIKSAGTNPWTVTPWFELGHRNQFALSPDGLAFAIANGGRLRIFNLPAAGDQK